MQKVKKISEFCIKNLKYITFTYVLTLVVLILFFTVRGDDFHFHMMRLNAIADEFRINGLSAFPVRMYSTVLDGYGYACPMFYGDIFMYPFALLTLIGTSVLNAYRLMKVCTLIAVYIVTVKISKKLYDDNTSADIFVAVYMISVTVYACAMGSAIGRAFATIFVPLAMYGIYMILYKDADYDWISLGVAVAGLLFSNALDCMICVFVLGVIFVFNIRKLNKKRILKFAKAVVVFIGLTLWFVLPMLEQMESQTFFVTSDKISLEKNDLSKYTVPLLGLFVPSKIYNKLLVIFNINSPHVVAYMSELLVFVFICVWGVAKYKSIKNDNFIMSMMILLIVFVWFQTKLFPFDIVKPIVGTMQFPYRVRIVMTILASFICVKLYETYKSKKTITVILSMSIAFLSLNCMMSVGIGAAKVILNKGAYMDYSYTMNDIMGSEYLPEKLMLDDYKYDAEFLESHKDKVICSDSETAVNFKRFDNYSELSFENNNGSSRFELPIIMYKGYEAVYADSEEMLPIASSAKGLIEVISDRTSAIVRVKYIGTYVQRISNIISFVFCVILFAYLCFKYYKKKSTKTAES